MFPPSLKIIIALPGFLTIQVGSFCDFYLRILRTLLASPHFGSFPVQNRSDSIIVKTLHTFPQSCSTSFTSEKCSLNNNAGLLVIMADATLTTWRKRELKGTWRLSKLGSHFGRRLLLPEGYQQLGNLFCSAKMIFIKSSVLVHAATTKKECQYIT